LAFGGNDFGGLVQREIVEEAMRGVRLFVATPCYGGNVTAEYLQSIVAFTQLAENIGLKFHLFTSKNESLVTRARNRAVAAFRKTDATHLMFIDSDIGFDPFSVFGMIMRDVDVVTASYPLKGIRWDSLLNKKFKNVADMQDATIQHVIRGMGKPDSETGLIPLDKAGTGFMLIKRDVVESMIDAHPEWAHDSEDPNFPGETWHAIFDCEIEDNSYLSEDYTFCRRWQRMGGKVWLDPMVTLTHTGSYTFGITDWGTK
jgi:hypothetical protein